MRRYAIIKRREVTNSNAVEVDAVNKGNGRIASSQQRWHWIQACCQEADGDEWENDEEQWEE